MLNYIIKRIFKSEINKKDLNAFHYLPLDLVLKTENIVISDKLFTKIVFKIKYLNYIHANI